MSSLVFTTKAPQSVVTRNGAGLSRSLAILRFWRWGAIFCSILMVALVSFIGEGLVHGLLLANLLPYILMLPVHAWLSLSCLLLWQHARWSTNCEITLDNIGLTYACGAGTFAWTWQDLRPFILYVPSSGLPRIKFAVGSGQPRIKFAIGKEGPVTRFQRMWREPRMILDAYDTSIEEIAAQLNEYRDRALGNSASSGSQSPSAGMDQP